MVEGPRLRVGAAGRDEPGSSSQSVRARREFAVDMVLHEPCGEARRAVQLPEAERVYVRRAQLLDLAITGAMRTDDATQNFTRDAIASL